LPSTTIQEAFAPQATDSYRRAYMLAQQTTPQPLKINKNKQKACMVFERALSLPKNSWK
jgi:hypothetical protein